MQQDLITVLYELSLLHIHVVSRAGLILLLIEHIKEFKKNTLSNNY